MNSQFLHTWDVTPREAIAIQERLRHAVIHQDQFGPINTVAGVDVGFEQQGAITLAAIVVLRFPQLELLEQSLIRQPTRFPYIPGLLSFREVPAILEAISRLSVVPDLLICDGQGLAHPRRFGFACHLGLLAGAPSIGVAKSLLVGEHAPVEQPRGSFQFLIDDDEVIGAALRTRSGSKPVYVSVGHRVSLETAIHYVMDCTIQYRLPEPVRQAHLLASRKSD